MKQSDVIKELIMLMEPASTKDEALKLTIISILNEGKKKASEDKKPEPEAKSKTKRGRPPFDIGKAKACYDAGWPIAKIADEMGVSAPTVKNHLIKAGVEMR